MRGPLPFKFENMWIRDESFKNLIKDWRQNLRFNGTKSYIILEKIKALKSRIKIWNRKVFGKWRIVKKQHLLEWIFRMRWKAKELCQVKSWKRE